MTESRETSVEAWATYRHTDLESSVRIRRTIFAFGLYFFTCKDKNLGYQVWVSQMLSRLATCQGV